jgi:hypothetical protein
MIVGVNSVFIARLLEEAGIIYVECTLDAP